MPGIKARISAAGSHRASRAGSNAGHTMQCPSVQAGSSVSRSEALGMHVRHSMVIGLVSLGAERAMWLARNSRQKTPFFSSAVVISWTGRGG